MAASGSSKANPGSPAPSVLSCRLSRLLTARGCGLAGGELRGVSDRVAKPSCRTKDADLGMEACRCTPGATGRGCAARCCREWRLPVSGVRLRVSERLKGTP